MEKNIYDEKNGLWYELRGEQYYPMLILPEEETRSVGVWGQRHLRYIKQHRRAYYTSLLTSGKLNSYLADLNEEAEEMFALLTEQMAERQGATETLKAENQMEWVRRMNNIYQSAREIVNHELIYA